MVGYLDCDIVLLSVFRKNLLNMTSYVNFRHVRAQGELSYHLIKVKCDKRYLLDPKGKLRKIKSPPLCGRKLRGLNKKNTIDNWIE